MSIKNLLFFVIISVFCTSCQRDSDSIDESNSEVTQIKTGYIFPGVRIMNQSEVNFVFSFDDQNRMIKKTGGFLPVDASSGFNASFTNQIYTTLNYSSDNKVLVEDFSALSEFTALKNTKLFTLNNEGKIRVKEIPDSHPYLFRKQDFIYNNGALHEIKTSFPNMPYDPNDPYDYLWTQSEKFFYDSAGNLIRTEFYEQNDGINTDEKIIRLFENYDNSSNPFKKLTLLDEYFYRSLSKNNFRTYKEVTYQSGNTSTSQRDWAFNYDTNGNIIIN